MTRLLFSKNYLLGSYLFFFSCFKAEITECLPKADASVGGAGGEAVKELRDYMTQVEQLKKERETLEEEFKGASVDMQKKFLEALAADGYVDTERITNQNLEEVYGEYKTQVEENVERQKQLIENIQVWIIFWP